MSVQPIKLPDGSTVYKVRWHDGTRHPARRFATSKAAEAFDRKVKDLKAAGELWRLDERPRGETTVRDFAWNVWWPEYAEVYVAESTRDSYAVQLDLRIIPKWGDHRLMDLRSGAIEAWAAKLRKQGVGDPTILRTLVVLRSILARAVKDEELDRNPAVGVKKPKQARTRRPRPIAPVYVELIRQHVLTDHERVDRRGRRLPARDPMLRLRDATLVSVLAYSGPRPESEAIPMCWDQVRKRTILYRATKSGKIVERTTQLVGPLASDLAAYRMRLPIGAGQAGELLFPRPDGDPWTGEDWDNWRERIFQPAAIAVGLPADTRPRDLRGSFASLLIYEGQNVVEVARQLGHSAATCLKDYASVFEEFDPADRQPAESIIRAARDLVASRPAEELIRELAAGGPTPTGPGAAVAT